MELAFAKAAIKALRAMQPKPAQAMTARLAAIAGDPMALHLNVKPLKGRKDAYRLRQGDWRAIYVIDRKAQRMHVLDIDTRGDIYK
ncbi:MAG: type II toxin-antitoxin system RelE/ParE family toxin [Proteobacteria bacterium]|nr:type II toxin-antitoxin system RelE/ParE family toxin [Pseudomonadota bacterium]